jgi:sulfur-oxidizing protein SoxY
MATRYRFLSRRDVAIGGACALLTALAARGATAQTDGLASLVKKLFVDQNFDEDRIRIMVPSIAENGTVVPVSITVESPMTPEDYVMSLHLFALENPVPQVGSYMFTPANGKAAISTRIRLAKSQDLLAIAEMSTRAIHAAKASVKIMIGGCG